MHAYTQRVASPSLQPNVRIVAAVATLDVRLIVKRSQQVQSRFAKQRYRTGFCRCSASLNDGDHYTGQLAACEADGDWLKAVELLAEVRALKLDLPGEAFEPAVRLCAQNGQWQKAVSILDQAHAQGSVSDATTVAVFTTLLRESQPAAALRLLKDMEQRGADKWEARGQCHNMVARTCARGGMLDEGLELLDNMYKAELHIQRDTYEALALGCLRSGRGERAEQLFEERDYM